MPAAFRPPFERIGPPFAATPLVLAVPHAGRDYPQALLAASAVPRFLLEELEDRHADALIDIAVRGGAVAIVARIARAWIDLNRGPDDLDPDQRGAGGGVEQSARSRTGLGLLPRRLGRRDLWRWTATAEEAAARIAAVHRPYHAAIATALADAVARHGHAVLIDCHSMPPLAAGDPAQVIVGDRHGRTAGAGLGTAMVGEARALGFRAALNAPYAGAYTVASHGDPLMGVQAVQVEIDRRLYLQRDMRSLADGAGRCARLIMRLGQIAIDAGSMPHAVAAE